MRHPLSFRAAPVALTASTLLALGLVLGACSLTDHPQSTTLPSFVVGLTHTYYDGSKDDLLTGGLGASGLASTSPPLVSSPPTAEELRRLAIYTNYRALVDTSSAGGFDTLYGPNVLGDGSIANSTGTISGTEYIAYADDGTGKQNVTLVVQLPDSFSSTSPCVLAAASPGSRGVYGAISVAEWGLKHGCAVALTDKGTGAAPQNLDPLNDTVPLIDGTRATEAALAASGVSASAQFSTGLSASQLAAFNQLTPNRFAFKHAHSGQNPQQAWGQDLLEAIQLAFYVINQTYGAVLFDGSHELTYKPGNTLVIAAGASNGGAAALAAAEQDTAGWITGVAVSEPALQMPAGAGVVVQRGGTPYAVTSLPLIDYITYANLFQSCATQAAALASAPGPSVDPTLAANRCSALHGAGLLAATTPAAQATEAWQDMLAYGWEPESAAVQPTLAAFEVAPAVSVTYANSLARASVTDNLCGFSFAATTTAGAVTPLAATSLDDMFGTGSGIPPNSGVQLVDNLNPGGALRAYLATSASTGLADFDFDGAQCLRALVGGNSATATALQQGLAQVRLNGNPNGKPVLIVHGRADGLIPVNHSSRPYAALAYGVNGDKQLSYIEVTNAHHFDAFNGLAGYNSQFVPLHLYLTRALDALYAHLTSGTALPPSQVVRTVPRGGVAASVPALSASNVPAIASAPAAADTIQISGKTINVPD